MKAKLNKIANLFLVPREIAYFNQRAILKPVFPHRIFTREATFLFSFVWALLFPLDFSQKLKDKEKKSLRAKIFASGKPAKDGYFY